MPRLVAATRRNGSGSARVRAASSGKRKGRKKKKGKLKKQAVPSAPKGQTVLLHLPSARREPLVFVPYPSDVNCTQRPFVSFEDSEAVEASHDASDKVDNTVAGVTKDGTNNEGAAGQGHRVGGNAGGGDDHGSEEEEEAEEGGEEDEEDEEDDGDESEAEERIGGGHQHHQPSGENSEEGEKEAEEEAEEEGDDDDNVDDDDDDNDAYEDDDDEGDPTPKHIVPQSAQLYEDGASNERNGNAGVHNSSPQAASNTQPPTVWPENNVSVCLFSSWKHRSIVNVCAAAGISLVDRDGPWSIFFGTTDKREAADGTKISFSNDRSFFRSMKPWQLVSHFPGTWALGRKDRLAFCINAMRRAYPGPAFEFLPSSFVMPKDAYHLKRFLLTKRSQKFRDNLWIIKPVSDSCGRGISVISTKTLQKRWPDYSDPRRKKKDIVVQEYVSDALVCRQALKLGSIGWHGCLGEHFAALA